MDTTRAAYLLVHNGIRRRHPNIEFILGHAGGFLLTQPPDGGGDHGRTRTYHLRLRLTVRAGGSGAPHRPHRDAHRRPLISTG